MFYHSFLLWQWLFSIPSTALPPGKQALELASSCTWPAADLPSFNRVLSLDKQQILKEFKMFARAWHREKLISGPMKDFYQGRYHGAAAVLLLADIITDEELKEIDKEAEEEAKNSV